MSGKKLTDKDLLWKALNQLGRVQLKAGEPARARRRTLDACRVLLRAAYAGTLFAAAELGLGPVVLTLIGGGVFGNPHPLIWDSILWAVEQTASLVHAPLHVVVNGREIEQTLGRERLVEVTRSHGGVFARVDRGRVSLT